MVSEVDAASISHGLAVKRRNALTATLFGGLLAAVFLRAFSFKAVGFFSGILLGLLYANAFEYLIHRFLLHARGRVFARYHLIHHSTWGAPDEPLYVNFARNPLVVILVFTIHAAPVLALEWILRAGLGPGMLVGFVVYFVAYEEIHWRIHFGGWLPFWLDSAREHHLVHHAAEDERFNVFLPIFDWLFGTAPGRRIAR